MSKSTDKDREHLEDIDPGAGCVGIWEHMTEARANNEQNSDQEEAENQR